MTQNQDLPLRIAPDPGHQLEELHAAVRANVEPQTVLAMIEAVAASVALLTNQNSHLEGALDSNRRVGAAMGILMARHNITEDQAFATLRERSQNSHRKLRDVAEEVVLVGELPLLATTRTAPPP